VATDSVKLNEFQCLYGAELNVSSLSIGLLQKALWIAPCSSLFRQWIYGGRTPNWKQKQLALEESIRVPLFIRWPGFFTPGEVNTDIMAFNIDIAPTLLDAAGASTSQSMDGTSLLKLYNGDVKRKYFYYQFAGDGPTPPIRAVRSSQYIYVKTYCNQLTEEFYDFATDPEENVTK